MSTEFELEVSRALGRIEQKVDDLGGPQGRVTKIEDHQTRLWWVSLLGAPLLTVLHAGARKLGIDV